MTLVANEISAFPVCGFPPLHWGKLFGNRFYAFHVLGILRSTDLTSATPEGCVSPGPVLEGFHKYLFESGMSCKVPAMLIPAPTPRVCQSFH